jgi:regulatory protein
LTPRLSLKARALKWLAQREHSRLELRRKLLAAASQDAQGGANPSDPAPAIDALLDWLESERHLSEARFVESRVHARSTRFGSRRILRELAQHGVTPDAEATDQLRRSELARARAVFERKFGAGTASADAQTRARQSRFLAGRGFAPDVIRQVVRGADSD